LLRESRAKLASNSVALRFWGWIYVSFTDFPATVAPVKNWNLAACSHQCLHYSAPTVEGICTTRVLSYPCPWCFPLDKYQPQLVQNLIIITLPWWIRTFETITLSVAHGCSTVIYSKTLITMSGRHGSVVHNSLPSLGTTIWHLSIRCTSFG
jgi:hypothetical protein